MSADNPIVADERARNPRLGDYDSVTARYEAKPDLYLRVSGDSMDRVGFVTGDVIAVQCKREPVNGEVIGARLGNEVTLKRFWCRDAITIKLQPESSNPEHRPCASGRTQKTSRSWKWSSERSSGRGGHRTLVRLPKPPEQAVEKIAGIDVHPVAIIFARFTYLLALLPALQKEEFHTDKMYVGTLIVRI